MTGAVPGPVWRAARAQHEAQVDALLADHLGRRSRGEAHPVLDFLFTYYSHRPARLRRWHPGLGVVLADADELLALPGYAAVPGGVGVAADAVARRRSTLDFVTRLLRATAGRPAQLGCFGMHEWAMVYRGGADAARHAAPLRLGPAGTDAAVEQVGLRCTHHDAFRFFTADARPRNAVTPTREDQVAREQPGCVHAGMDLYKWAYKLEPLVASTLVLDCFRHAAAARELDMRASPYDLRAWGYSPVAVEQPAGRAEYVRAQAQLAQRAAPLRAEVLAAGDRALLERAPADRAVPA
ncbi:hypothetical protein GCM10027047_19580 [Rhodococcus aerolatus]